METMRYTVRLIAFITFAGAALAPAIVAVAGPKKNLHQGHSGQLRYWHKGKCLDASNPKESKTWPEEILAKQWKY